MSQLLGLGILSDDLTEEELEQIFKDRRQTIEKRQALHMASPMQPLCTRPLKKLQGCPPKRCLSLKFYSEHLVLCIMTKCPNMLRIGTKVVWL